MGSEDFPIVPEDVEVALYAKDPLVRNPCVITFDSQVGYALGWVLVYRAPGQKSPADSVWIITDEDGDGLAETRKEFATGFNSVQGLAWKGDWLWVANAPELTRVRDTNGDDLADEYIRVYTDLGNLEHALHGLNFGPDGRLYCRATQRPKSCPTAGPRVQELESGSEGNTRAPAQLSAAITMKRITKIHPMTGATVEFSVVTRMARIWKSSKRFSKLGTSPLMITLTGLEQTMTKPWGQDLRPLLRFAFWMGPRELRLERR